jgi:hypothetical protein
VERRPTAQRLKFANAGRTLCEVFLCDFIGEKQRSLYDFNPLVYQQLAAAARARVFFFFFPFRLSVL